MSTRPLILIADDETKIRRLVTQHLEEAGFDICQAQDGKQALEVCELLPQPPDLVILDLMMPEMDGHEVLKRLRQMSTVPVLILTARDFLLDKRKSFETGADDYLIKPFSLDELVLRIQALLRRSQLSQELTHNVLTNGPLTLYRDSQSAQWDKDVISLTHREFILLWELMKHPGKIVHYDKLLLIGWDGQAQADVSHLRVAMARLRKKISEAGAQPSILTSYTNVGYMLGDLSHYEDDYGF
jgi:DNA-binding response OmpR family regulator